MNPDFEEIGRRHKATVCLDCDLCLEVCPAHRYDEEFAPKTIAGAVLKNSEIPDRIWTCLTCRQCETRCPVEGVRFAYFIRDMRALSFEAGSRPKPSHGGVLPSIQRIMAKRDLAQNRLGFLTQDLRIDPGGDTLLSLGCIPYYEDLFADELGFHPIDSAKGALRLLNAVGTEPAVTQDEVCCGHDMLWTGDVASFKALAQKNVDTIHRLKIKRIVSVCPECVAAMSQDYPEFFGKTDFSIVHISQILAERIDTLQFDPLDATVAYWDSCRAGRYCGLYSETRELVARAAKRVVELASVRENSKCCGSPCFAGCGTVSRGLQEEILLEAERAGAQILITACPRAEIHFRCALRSEAWQATHLEVAELAAFLASRLGDPNETRARP